MPVSTVLDVEGNATLTARYGHAVADVHGLFRAHGYVDLPGVTHLERNLVFLPEERRLELSGCRWC